MPSTIYPTPFGHDVHPDTAHRKSGVGCSPVIRRIALTPEVSMAPRNTSDSAIRNVIVVDPSFGSYRELAAASREGRIELHMRASGLDALRLADHVEADAWIVAADLDDMSEIDFIEALRCRIGAAAPVCSSNPTAEMRSTIGELRLLPAPVTCDEVEALIDSTAVTPSGSGHSLAKFLALPAAGIGLATSIIIIALQAG